MTLRMITTAIVAVLFATPLRAGEGDAGLTVAKFDPRPYRESRPELSLLVKEKYQFYDIDGTSSSALRRQMRENGTKWDDGHRYAALTTWDIRYRYDVAAIQGLYSVSSVTTDIGLVYRYPRWAAAEGSEERLAALWNSYMSSLTVHELGHKAIAVKAAEDINEILSSLHGFGSRRELDEEASRKVRARLDKLKADQIAYDAETRHGETQGAVLADL